MTARGVLLGVAVAVATQLACTGMLSGTSGGGGGAGGSAGGGGGGAGGGVATAGAPALMFSDLVSGPSTGNSDNSQPGQTAAQDGAIVTVWGKNLGAGGTIAVGGVNARIYSWGPASAPADLVTRHGMQMVAFQVPHQVPDGATTLVATVGGVASNPLPFKVRPGSIFFVTTTGNDTTGDGSWSKPWAKVSKATAGLAPGSIIYLGNGVTQSTNDGDRSTLDLDTDPSRLATEAMPKALVGYPGATAKIGTTTLNAWSLFVSGAPTPAPWWTISKLVLTGRNVAAAYSTGFRIIANRISAPLGDDQTGAIGGDDSSQLAVLGNELTDCGYAGTSKLYHPMYIQSRESNVAPRLPNSDNREVAWNYLHDNKSYDGINFYREGSFSAYMTNTRCHDNFIINQTGRGLLVGSYLTGPDNHFYNNVIINAGLGPVPAGPFAGDPAFGYVCVQFSAGAVGNPATTIHFYNNTLVGCGFDGGPLNTAGAIAVGTAYPFNLDFRNNLVVATTFPFIQPYSDTTTTTAGNNLWFGGGGPVPNSANPAIFAAPITADPMLVDAANGNVRLSAGSPAINAGSATAPVPPVDFDHLPRPQGSGYDVGAFEWK